MNETEKKLIVRSRAIILNEGKLLVVKHRDGDDFYAIPGGHIEWAENPKECLAREIFEELGIMPKIGRLLYINTFTEKDSVHSVEFFFEITNGKDYLDTTDSGGTHRHELFEILWIDRSNNLNILPEAINSDFKNGNIISDSVRFIPFKDNVL